MKSITVVALIVVLAFLAASDASVMHPQKTQFQRVIASAAGKPCKCIPWRQCHGEMNSEVYCQPWYGMTCCVIPEPEQRPEELKNGPEVVQI